MPRSDEDRRAARREANRRWREKHPDYFKKWRASLSDDAAAEQSAKKGASYQRRRAAALAADEAGARRREAEATKRWYAAHREAMRDKRRAYYLANGERLREKSREWNRAHPEYMRAKMLRKYGITPAEYDALLDAQRGVCAICQQPETTILRGKIKALHVDHDHTTGRVRGLLCFRCNAALGHFHDDPVAFERAAAYLRAV